MSSNTEQNLLNQLVVLIDDAVSDLENLFVTQNTSESSKFQGSLRKFKDTSSTDNTVNNTVNNAVNSVVNSAVGGASNSIISTIISSITSVIDGLVDETIDPIVNGIISKFQSKLQLKSLQQRFILQKLKSFKDNPSTIVNNVVNQIVTNAVNKVDPNASANLVNVVTGIADQVTDYLVLYITNLIKKKRGKPVTTPATSPVPNIVNILSNYISSITDNVIKNILDKFVKPKQTLSLVPPSVPSGLLKQVYNEFKHVEQEFKSLKQKILHEYGSLLSWFQKHKPKLNLRITRNPNAVKLKLNLKNVSNLPSKFSLRSKMGPVWAQGDLGSCTSFSSTKVFQYHSPGFNPSQLFQYQQELIMDGTPYVDNGSTLVTAYACLKKNGVCSAETWPYDVSKFSTPAPNAAYNEALLNRDLQDAVIGQTLEELKTCLADPAYQTPISFGVMLFESFENESTLDTGIVPMPNIKTEALMGGHAIVITGYDDTKQMFEIMNSWDDAVGDGGFFYFPYKYILNAKLTSDFHTLYKTSSPQVETLKAVAPTNKSSSLTEMKTSTPRKHNCRPDSLGRTVSKGYKDSGIIIPDKAPTLPRILPKDVSKQGVQTRSK